MILLPLPDPNKNGTTHLLIVLEDDNLARMKRHDNAEINWIDLMHTALPGSIAIGYASPREMNQIKELLKRGDMKAVLKLITGGWEFRPDLGDHDRGPEPLVKPS